MTPIIARRIHDRIVHVRCWKYEVNGNSGTTVPVYLLDTDVGENGEWDRRLTDRLYLGDHCQWICQEVVLGQGGVEMLKELGHNSLEIYHMNEGHSALLGLELLDEAMERRGIRDIDADVMNEVRMKCVFTTHTPGQRPPDAP